MRLRDLFMILLLCMTVGVLGTSCTGDDGEAGAPGEQGEQGEQGPEGPPGDLTEEEIRDLVDDAVGDTGSMESNYPFLKTWGKPSGRMACNDPLLTEEGMFPGTGLTALTEEQMSFDPVAPSTETDSNLANGYVTVRCKASVFDAVANPDLDGKEGGDLTITDGTSPMLLSNMADNDGTDPQLGALVFVKTHTGGDKDPVVQSGEKEAIVGKAGEKRTVQKSFTQGLFFANMDGSAVGEAAGRYDLYSDCDKGDGTVPPELKGEWQAVTILDIHKNTKLDTNGLSEDIDDSIVTRTTKKVCIRLDALPGAVKCYVREEVDVMAATEDDQTGVATGLEDDATEKIIIYGDGTNSMVVDPKPASGSKLLGPDDAATLAGAEGVQFISRTENDFQGVKLCNLFSEAEE